MAKGGGTACVRLLPATRDLNDVVVVIFMADVTERAGAEEDVAVR